MRQEVYRVALDEASAELSEILTRFDQLRVRKDRIEKVVEALKPLVQAAEEAAAAVEHNSTVAERLTAVPEPVAHPVPVEATPASSQVPYPVQQAVEEANDPFSRRPENPLGLGSSARDVREYSRLFTTGSSRGN